MRLTRTLGFWLFLLSLASTVASFSTCPDGYLRYSFAWLSALGTEEIWYDEQKRISESVVQPVLARWRIEDQAVLSNLAALSLHRSGSDHSNSRFDQLKDAYERRGISVIESISYSSDMQDAQAEKFVEAIFPSIKDLLPFLFYAADDALIAEHAKGKPRAAWVYVIFHDPDLMVYWPGGNQYDRYELDRSPSLAYDGDDTGNTWFENITSSEYAFEPASGDSLGFGNTMITSRRIEVDGRMGIIAADVYWENGPVGYMRGSVALYASWVLLSCVVMIASVMVMFYRVSRLFSNANGVCVTVDIVGWSGILDVQDRFSRQEALSQHVSNSFTNVTKQRVLRWSTGDGFHVLFIDVWGARIYLEPLKFVSDLLNSWNHSFDGRSGEPGGSLRVAIGSHGSVQMVRRSSLWYALGDRLVSAVRIDEVSKSEHRSSNSKWRVSCEASYLEEVRKNHSQDFEQITEDRTNVRVALDKAGVEHRYVWFSVKSIGRIGLSGRF